MMKWCCFICLPDDELCCQLVSQKEDEIDTSVCHKNAQPVDDRVAYSPTMHALGIQKIIPNLQISIAILHRVMYPTSRLETLAFVFRDLK